jgi:hypothetical protein
MSKVTIANLKVVEPEVVGMPTVTPLATPVVAPVVVPGAPVVVVMPLVTPGPKPPTE